MRRTVYSFLSIFDYLVADSPKRGGQERFLLRVATPYRHLILRLTAAWQTSKATLAVSQSARRTETRDYTLSHKFLVVLSKSRAAERMKPLLCEFRVTGCFSRGYKSVPPRNTQKGVRVKGESVLPLFFNYTLVTLSPFYLW